MAKKKSNTGLIVGIVAALAAVGVIIYSSKKEKKDSYADEPWLGGK